MDFHVAQVMRALARHDRVALQLSGGRDSIAVLYLLRPWLDRITVYWVNTGAAMPETIALMAQLRTWIPHFVEVLGDQPGHIERFGIPSDLVPTSATPVGRLVSGSIMPAIQDRYTCCINVIMLPMQKAMLADGITLIIRGQKNADKLKSSSRSGTREYGAELLFPIEDWTSADVMAYLRSQGAPIPRFYDTLNSAPDCLTCTAYWEEGHAAYLAQHHPFEHAIVQKRLDLIMRAAAPHIAQFNQALAPIQEKQP
jgi:phosphoadenosine phosphosulfate reductase